MKITIKNLLIILAILGIGYAVVQFTKRTGKSKSLKSELVSIDTTKVTKIAINSPDGEVLLASSGAGWKVSLADGKTKPAREGVVQSLLTSLISIKPARLASRKKDKWKDYAVDSTGTRVKVYEGEDLTTDIVIGRFGVEGQRSFYSFVRLFADENVYVANDFMGMSVGKKPEDYRESVLMRLTSDSLTRITFDYPDSAFSFIKNDKKWFVNEQLVDSASTAKYFSDMNYLTSKSFFDDSEVSGNPLQSITFSFSDRPDIRLDSYSMNGKSVVTSTENKFEAFADEALNEKIFKGKSAFFPTLK